MSGPEDAPAQTSAVSEPFHVLSAQEHALYRAAPAAGQGPFRERDDLLSETPAEPPPADCAGAEITARIRDHSADVSLEYSLKSSDARVSVRLYQLEQDVHDSVERGLRAARHCTGRHGVDRLVWTKLANPWFGDGGVVYRTGRHRAPPQDEPYTKNVGVQAFSASGGWLLETTSDSYPGATVAAVAEVQRRLGHAWDPVLGTDFARPTEATGGCGSPPIDLDDLPDALRYEFELPNQLIELHKQLVGSHDAACQGDMAAVGGGMSGPLVLDDEVVLTPDSLALDDPAALARVLESPPTFHNGALVFRNGASVAVFSTAQDFSWNEAVEWTAFVEGCGAATGQAGGMCDDDPHGPLGALDWQTEIGPTACTGADGYGPTVEQALFRDVTGDGRKEAVLAFTCTHLRTPVPGDVLVYDGASPPDAPVLLQALLRDDPGRAEFGLWPVALSMEGDSLVVDSFTWREADRSDPADVQVADWFRWQSGAFARVRQEIWD